MSLLYSILKPIVRKAVKENKHREETYEDFVRTSYELQEKFQLKLPKKNGYEFQIMDIDGFQVIIGHKTGAKNRNGHCCIWSGEQCGDGSCLHPSQCCVISRKRTGIYGFRSIRFSRITRFWTRST